MKLIATVDRKTKAVTYNTQPCDKEINYKPLAAELANGMSEETK